MLDFGWETDPELLALVRVSIVFAFNVLFLWLDGGARSISR